MGGGRSARSGRSYSGGEGRAPPRAEVHAHADLLAGRGNSILVEVEQRLEQMEALGVVAEDDRLDGDTVSPALSSRR